MNGSFNLNDKMIGCCRIFDNFCVYVRFLRRFLYAFIKLIISAARNITTMNKVTGGEKK